ncbi:hypothetical protein BC937DRAFT_88334 [Endogone sp. FLAS-F59071]|nr:hypothetical protein BC937DRAFT_88334 [Endogone sp. FLAS-F59071]|eukprot:RUS18793.1 hypothetical protein BC937DRAFT_88334 [Endogone sp. FLAS-F59071]
MVVIQPALEDLAHENYEPKAEEPVLASLVAEAATHLRELAIASEPDATVDNEAEYSDANLQSSILNEATRAEAVVELCKDVEATQPIDNHDSADTAAEQFPTEQLPISMDDDTSTTVSPYNNDTPTVDDATAALAVDNSTQIQFQFPTIDFEAQQRRASRILEFERIIATIEPSDKPLQEEDHADETLSLPTADPTSPPPTSFIPINTEDDEPYLVDPLEATDEEILFSASDAVTTPTSDSHNDFFYNDPDERGRKHQSFSSTFSYIPFSVSDLTTPATSLDLESGATSSELQRPADIKALDRDRLDAAQIKGTKDVFTETQKMAYVGLCAVTSLEIVHELDWKEASYARMSADNWQRKLMRNLYRHMEVSKEEQVMIESLDKHDIRPTDLVENFISQGTTTTIPLTSLSEEIAATAAKSGALDPDISVDKDLPPVPSMNDEEAKDLPPLPEDEERNIVIKEVWLEQHAEFPITADPTPSPSGIQDQEEMAITLYSSPSLRDVDADAVPVTYESSSQALEAELALDTHALTPLPAAPLIIDLRWTVICDLFLMCISESNYDARSRVFLARVAQYLGLEWYEVVAFERRVTEQLNEGDVGLGDDFSMSEDLDDVKSEKERKGRNKQQQARRYLMIGLATLGGGLVLGLSAGLMAPVIGAGFGAILTTVGVSGTTAFLGGGGGIALITTGATVAGGGRGKSENTSVTYVGLECKMGNRTKGVETFEFVPMQDNERVCCIVSITGWLTKADDKEEAGYAFSTIDPVMGDHHALFWEPEMLVQLGSAFKIIASEAIGTAVQQALAHTVAGVLMAGLNFPMAISKLAYLIDNPWANALDRSCLAGLILADTLMNRKLGVRPITLIGFSLGARVIFYCLLELARVNAFGIVENVFIFGTPVIASQQQWREASSVVAGRFVNGYARSDWLLGFLFRASAAGLGSIAGLRPIKDVPRIENVDCTDLIRGHMHYRNSMPRILAKVGIKVTSETLSDKGDTMGEKGSRNSVMGLVGFGRSSSSLSLDMSRKGKSNPRLSIQSSPGQEGEIFSRGLPAASMDQEASDTSTSPPTRSPLVSSFSSGQASISILTRNSTPGSDGESGRSPTTPVSGSPRNRGSSWFSRNRMSSSSLALSTPSTPLEHEEERDKEGTPSSGVSSGAMTPTGGYFDEVATRRPSAHTLELEGGGTEEEEQVVVVKVVEEERQRGAVDLDEVMALATAAAVSSTSRNTPKSSLSTGTASISLVSRSPSPNPSMMSSPANGTLKEADELETAEMPASPATPTSPKSVTRNSTSSRSSISGFFGFSRKKPMGPSVDEQGLEALEEAGIHVKEIKVTLPKMVIPQEVANPVPEVSLQAPPSVRRW